MPREHRSHPPVPRWRRAETASRRWFQLRIVGYYVLILLGGAAGLAYFIHRHAHRALRFEMFRSHSTAATPWEVIRDGVLLINVAAAAAVVVVAIVATLIITRSVGRAADRLTGNLRRTREGGTMRDWEPPPDIYEFKHLHRLLEEGLGTHHEKVEELRMLAGILRGKARDARDGLARPGAQGCSRELRDLHVQCEKLRGAADRFTLRKP